MTSARNFLAHTRIAAATAVVAFHALAGVPVLAPFLGAATLAPLAWDAPTRIRGRVRLGILAGVVAVGAPAFLAGLLHAPALPAAGAALALALLAVSAIQAEPFEHALVHVLSLSLVVLLLARSLGPPASLAAATWLVLEVPALSGLHLEILAHRQRVRTEATCRALRVPPPPPPPPSRLGVWHATGLALGILFLACGLGLYLLIPRWQLVKAPPPLRPDPVPELEGLPDGGGPPVPWRFALSGFTPRMELQRSVSIRASDRPVFFARLLAEGYAFRAADESVLYWRGRTLWSYDGLAWTDPGRRDLTRGLSDADGDGWIELPDPPAAGRLDAEIVQSIHIHPTAERTLFALAEPTRVETPTVRFGPDRALSLARSPNGEHSYRVVSRVHLPGPVNLARARIARAEPRFLELPSRDEELARLAAGWTAEAHTDYDRVRALAGRLRRHCAYSLEFALPSDRDPVSGFLLATRKGHCELFAASMVVLLRTLGLPARVAIGFRGGRWDDYSQGYAVSERDAHAWVEVPFEGHGWVLFDPTPGGAIDPPSPLALEGESLPETAPVPGAPEVTPEEATSEPAGSWYDFLLHYDRETQRRFLGGAADLFAPEKRTTQVLLVALALGLPLVWVATALVRRRFARGRAEIRGEAGELAGGRIAVRFYDRALRALARHGFARRAPETPGEFALRVTSAVPGKVAEQLRELTEAFETVRYGARPLDPESVRRVREAGSRLDASLRSLSRARPGAGEP